MITTFCCGSVHLSSSSRTISDSDSAGHHRNRSTYLLQQSTGVPPSKRSQRPSRPWKACTMTVILQPIAPSDRMTASREV